MLKRDKLEAQMLLSLGSTLKTMKTSIQISETNPNIQLINP